MAYSIMRLLRVVSMIACLIVLASFAIFVVDQSTNASGQQQEEVAQSGGQTTHPTAAAGSHPSGLHKAIDEAANQITSPFAGIVSSTSSEWGSQIVRLLLSLIVYGLGVGYLVRVVSVRI
jgi:hypothetical protein